MKKILAIALAAVMLLTITSAFATEPPTGGYNEGTADNTTNVYEHYTDAADATTKTYFDQFVVKTIVDMNADLAGFAATSFKYTLAAGTAISASDASDGNKVPVFEGPTGAKLIYGTTNVALGSELTVAFDAGTEDTTKEIKVDVSAVTWPHAGIYRYTLTQAALTAEQSTVGFQSEATNGKDAVIKYIDIYVANTAATGETPVYKVTNAVVNNSLTSVLTVNSNNLISYSGKTDNFTNTFGEDVKDPEDPHKDDNTTNVIIVTKEVTGSMGDVTYQFPFDLTVFYTEPTGEGNDSATTLAGTAFKVEVVGTTGAVVTAPTDGWKIFASDAASTTYTGAITIPNGGQVKITVPNNVYVKVKEMVEESLGYTVSSEVTEAAGQTLATAQAATANKKIDETGIGGTIAYTTKDTNVGLKWTNNLEQISPTGVVLRFAPYFAMFAAGCVLFIILATKRSKKEEE
ncbi:MAG: hypothetical protein IJJ42_03090 [Clostridia bacterium]|nr:hypothetical protein [Clostridia bacterium]